MDLSLVADAFFSFANLLLEFFALFLQQRDFAFELFCASGHFDLFSDAQTNTRKILFFHEILQIAEVVAYQR